MGGSGIAGSLSKNVDKIPVAHAFGIGNSEDKKKKTIIGSNLKPLNNGIANKAGTSLLN